jgi:hypothetical protein
MPNAVFHLSACGPSSGLLTVIVAAVQLAERPIRMSADAATGQGTSTPGLNGLVVQDLKEQLPRTPPNDVIQEAAAGGTVHVFEPDASPQEKANQVSKTQDKLKPVVGAAPGVNGRGEHRSRPFH